MRTIIPFNENWLFEKPGEAAAPVTLPHTWNAVDGQDGGGDFWRGECVYRKDFPAPERAPEEEVYLEFDGVSASARVELNGRSVGEHHGGAAERHLAGGEFSHAGGGSGDDRGPAAEIDPVVYHGSVLPDW